jgi:hypothetical protein
MVVGMKVLVRRREFLIQSVSLAVIVPVEVQILSIAKAVAADSLDGFSPEELNFLATAMDEIVPQNDNTPSVSLSGGLMYLQELSWEYPKVLTEIKDFLRELQRDSQERFNVEFGKLESGRRAELLKSIEKSKADLFSGFVSYVYEAYYTRPKVQGLLYCATPEFSQADDELLLSPVRKLTHLYRDAP